MTVKARDRRALLLLAAAVVLILALRWALSGDEQPQVVSGRASIPLAEKRLARLRQLAAGVPGKAQGLSRWTLELARREQGLIQAETGPQAQAHLLQIMRGLSKTQAPPVEIRAVEMGHLRPLGQDYGEATVSVVFGCQIEQLVNLLADLTAQPEILATDELRVSSAGAKEKAVSVRLTVSGVMPRRLLPERKGF